MKNKWAYNLIFPHIRRREKMNRKITIISNDSKQEEEEEVYNYLFITTRRKKYVTNIYIYISMEKRNFIYQKAAGGSKFDRNELISSFFFIWNSMKEKNKTFLYIFDVYINNEKELFFSRNQFIMSH